MNQKLPIKILAIGSLFLIVYAVILVGGIQFFEKLPFWFIVPHQTKLNYLYLIPPFICLILCCYIVNKHIKTIYKLLIIFLTGILLQYSLALSKGGIDTISNRMISSGHSEFVKSASKIVNAFEFLSNYEQLRINNKIGFFASSKPPGTSLIYIIFDRLSNNDLFKDKVLINDSYNEREKRLIRVSTFTWPFLSCLPIFIIFILGRKFYSENASLIASITYILIPSINLIQLHTDQTFYPIFSILSGYLFINSLNKSNELLSILTGIIFFIATFLSFGLLSLLVLFVTYFFLNNFNLSTFKVVIIAILAFLSLSYIFYTSFNYNHYQQYLNATAHHQSVKGWDGFISTLITTSFINILEYFIWLGLPFAVLVCYSFLYICFNRDKLPFSFFNLCISILFLFIAILIFGKTKSETGRLWIFINPYVCLILGYFIFELSRLKNSKYFLFTFILIQYLSICLTLNFQDFI